MEFPLLSILISLPFFAAIIISCIPSRRLDSDHVIKNITLFFSVLTFIFSVFIWYAFDNQQGGYQFVEIYSWFYHYDIKYFVGIDSISLYFILLTTFLTIFCILASFNSIRSRVKEYMICFLLLEFTVIAVFCALDIFLFYVFFEVMLIPMFIIIGIWGGENRVYATIKFFLYTFAGSLCLLAAIIYVFNVTETANIIKIVMISPDFSLDVQKYLWIAMLIAFAVKIPMWPFHTWLPDAHVQAPTAGSMILAGILLKMGAYGFLRFLIPMFPKVSIFFAPYMMTIGAVAIIYASLVALVQQDMKKMIAYSSIAHMGYVVMGIFTFTVQGIEGAIFQMISHGLVSSALFLSIGILYDRMHTKEIIKYGGVVTKMPKFATIFLILTMASIGLPGSSGFVGEFLVLIGVYEYNKIFAFAAATGLFLGAAYMLWLYKRVMFGVVNNNVKTLHDISLREKFLFLPFVILIILLGVYPSLVTDNLHIAVGNFIKHTLIR